VITANQFVKWPLVQHGTDYRHKSKSDHRDRSRGALVRRRPPPLWE
jgi:hypothetical protein